MPVMQCSRRAWVGMGVSNECALAWPVRAFVRGSSDGAAVMVAAEGCGLVVVRNKGMMGQCLAMGGCQTLQLLLINV